MSGYAFSKNFQVCVYFEYVHFLWLVAIFIETPSSKVFEIFFQVAYFYLDNSSEPMKISKEELICIQSFRTSPSGTKLIYLKRNLSGKGDIHRANSQIVIYDFNSGSSRLRYAHFLWFLLLIDLMIYILHTLIHEIKTTCNEDDI